ncbi:hypothetical protein F5H01DRAFT_103001 [Linnemannia elongata]|nr:hypothetical protein F5H01DRAFT_103001 [Linnemannia elongata]
MVSSPLPISLASKGPFALHVFDSWCAFLCASCSLLSLLPSSFSSSFFRSHFFNPSSASPIPLTLLSPLHLSPPLSRYHPSRLLAHPPSPSCISFLCTALVPPPPPSLTSQSRTSISLCFVFESIRRVGPSHNPFQLYIRTNLCPSPPPSHTP